MTPFAHTPIRRQLEAEGRILDNDFRNYTCDRVVFQPKRMTPAQLQDMYYYAWETFYGESPQEVKMGKLFTEVMRREIANGTYLRPTRPALRRQD